MDINYELYKVFYYVAISLSFSEASKKLYISQSAVSQSIKVLEKKLNQPLFIRSTKKVQLTPEGETLLRHVEPAMNLIRRGEAQILAYNARQQVLNLFYPEQMQQISEQVGFSPEADEEISALFDCMTETFDRETAKSCYVQYRFEQTAPEGAQTVFYITVERNTGFVLPQFEWASDGQEQEFPDVSEEDYRYFNRIMREIVLYQGVSEQDIRGNSLKYERYQIAKEFWDSVC